MEKKVSKNQFERVDDYNPGVDYSNSIQEKWVHKQVVKKTGEGEDDFIIEEKPFLVESVDLHKSIQEEAKTTDLKYLIKQLLLTGDESYINKKQGFYGDITGVQKAIQGHQLPPSAEVIKENLPEELKGLSVEQIASMSDSDLAAYIQKVKSLSDIEAICSTDNL